MEHVVVGGTQIAYTRADPGRPSSWSTAPRRTAALGSGCSPTSPATTPSSPGTRRASGSRQTSTTPGSAAEFADALAAFIVTLDLERPHLVGHSFGTMVALSCFQRHPAAPASLVLIGGYAGWAGSLPPEEVARRLEMFLGMAELGDAFDPKSYRVCSRTSYRATATRRWPR